MRVYLPVTRYPEVADMLPVLTNLHDRLRDVPGVEAGALASAAPLIGGGGLGVEVDGRAAEPGETPRPATPVTVSEGYFATLGLDPLQGRTFTRSDGEPGSESVIVNQRFVEVHLGGGEALGRRVRLGAAPDADPAEGWMTVVGVVPDVRQAAIEEEETDPVAYRPLRATAIRNPFIMLRTVGDQGAVTSRVRDVMRTVEPDVPVYEVNTMEYLLTEQRWAFRVFGIMFSFFGATALLLSAVGLYSITAHSVVQRMREFGIRVSLGALPRQISRLALRRVLVQLAIGVPIGVAGAYAVGRLIQGFLVETAPGEPLVLVGIVVLLVSVAVTACLVPARRAGSVDPVTALRVE
jgi:predicted permease